MKKYILAITIILGIASFTFSQKVVDKKIEAGGKLTEMNLSFAENITIEAWNNNYIELHASANIDNNKYNDFYTLNVNEKSGKIEIEEIVDFDGIKKKTGSKNLNNFNTEISYKLKIPQNLNFNVNTISGEIELVGCEGEMTVNSVSGFIDYSIPEKHKVKIDLSTVTGNVYSNVKFDNPLPKEISWVGTDSELTLNGGNKDVELKTVSGDIYLRKY
jgi:DUF4097 and DUF4098 domain-containing protein YvlB